MRSNTTLQPPSRAQREFAFATFGSRGLRLNVEPDEQGKHYMRIMKVASAILLIVVLALAWRLKSVTAVVTHQQQLLAERQQQIEALHRELEDKSVQEALSLQTQCSEMASKFLSSRGWKPGVGEDYRNHFNSKLKRCFVLVSSYLPKDDFVTIELYDAVEGRRYAIFNGHQICDVAITKNPKKCALDSGSIWFDGNDTRHPADFTAGFRGLLYGGGSGDENTHKTFLDHIQLFMSE